MKSKIIPIVSVCIGVLAFLLTYQFLLGERRKLKGELDRIYAGAQRVRVMAAAQDIPGGTVIKPSDLGTISVFKSSVGTHVVLPDEAAMLFGRKTMFPIKAKEPVFWSHIEGGALSAMGLSPIITPGMRAVSVAASGADAVSGMVQPNDRVDVLGTFSFPSKKTPGEMESVTLTVLQDVSVLATGQKLAKQQVADRFSRTASTYNTITLEVTSSEAELLVFAQQLKGRITFTLRNPGDVSFKADMPEVDFSYLQTEIPKLNDTRQRTIRRKPGP